MAGVAADQDFQGRRALPSVLPLVVADPGSAIAARAEEQREHGRRPHRRDRPTIPGRVAVTGEAVRVPDLPAARELRFPLPASPARNSQAAIAFPHARLVDAVERRRTELARFVTPQVAIMRWRQRPSGA